MLPLSISFSPMLNHHISKKSTGKENPFIKEKKFVILSGNKKTQRDMKIIEYKYSQNNLNEIEITCLVPYP